MEPKIKVLFRLFFVASFFSFSSCEKDLYEDALQKTSQPIIQKISLSDIARAGTN